MSYQYIDYRKEDGIAWVSLNRPEVLNAISPALLVEMKDALEKAGGAHRSGQYGRPR